MRRFFSILHKWLSIPAGIIISITCLTGAILVFQDEILELCNPSHYFVESAGRKPIPLSELVPQVNSQLKDNAVAGVTISPDPSRTYKMSLQKGFRITSFVDPYTGQIVGEYSTLDSPFFTVMSVHRWLLDGSRTWGKYIVGICTSLLVFILISGFFLWFPRLKKKSRFKIQFRKGRKRLMYDLHNVLGAYVGLIILVCALTGLMWSFEWYRNSVTRLFGGNISDRGQAHKRGRSANEEIKQINAIQWDKAFNTVKNSNPDYEYIRVEDGTISVHMKHEVVSSSQDQYKFDATTGEIVKTLLYKDLKAESKVMGWAYSLHVGNYWGIWSKILIFAASLIGASLPITGYYMFYIKRKKNGKKPIDPVS